MASSIWTTDNLTGLLLGQFSNAQNSFAKRVIVEGLTIVIENPRGSYKSFEIENDPVWKDYPLTGVTYPVDYGYIVGYHSEDGHDLDVFLGTGKFYGYIRIFRMDVPVETKMVMRVTPLEWRAILVAFAPVLVGCQIFKGRREFHAVLKRLKSR